MTLLFLIYWTAFLFSLFVVGCILGAAFSPTFREKLKEIAEAIGRRDLSLARIIHNPVLRPSRHLWQAAAVFNPAALILNGRTHLVYRSVGTDGVSRMGYASSPDGLFFDERLPYPMYVLGNPRNVPRAAQRYSPVMYPSGGSWGGCEDPRMVTIDGRVYITFNMFDGWDYIRVGLISISTEDFLAKNFQNLSAPTVLSKPGQRHKNWVLFPEKIGGKFAVIHSISPKVEVAYCESLEGIGTTEPFIESWDGPRASVPVREKYWDNYVRSAGPPPLKTPHGWLLFYHANDKREIHRYKLGVMLLDLNEPTTVLYRSSHPVLEPDAPYENEGKPGIVYACGATIKDDTVYVYYGGADQVICVAFAPLEAFLKALMVDEHLALNATPLKIN